jgi:hypothetical protein
MSSPVYDPRAYRAPINPQGPMGVSARELRASVRNVTRTPSRFAYQVAALAVAAFVFTLVFWS